MVVNYPNVQVKKLQDRLDKTRKDVESAKDKYEEALAVLHKYNNTYVDDMTEVFEKTQIFEEKRLRAFKDILVGVQRALDISKREE
jgi:protein kinase C and casein kinase substrate in neurons protein